MRLMWKTRLIKMSVLKWKALGSLIRQHISHILQELSNWPRYFPGLFFAKFGLIYNCHINFLLLAKAKFILVAHKIPFIPLFSAATTKCRDDEDGDCKAVYGCVREKWKAQTFLHKVSATQPKRPVSRHRWECKPAFCLWSAIRIYYLCSCSPEKADHHHVSCGFNNLNSPFYSRKDLLARLDGRARKKT